MMHPRGDTRQRGATWGSRLLRGHQILLVPGPGLALLAKSGRHVHRGHSREAWLTSGFPTRKSSSNARSLMFDWRGARVDSSHHLCRVGNAARSENVSVNVDLPTESPVSMPLTSCRTRTSLQFKKMLWRRGP